MGENNSTLKDTALSITGSLAAMGHAIAGDEILKNSFANFAFENFEIAAYKSLITVGSRGGFSAAVEALTKSLDEEVDMARWLDENLEKVTLKFVARRQANLTAKTDEVRIGGSPRHSHAMTMGIWHLDVVSVLNAGALAQNLPRQPNSDNLQG